MSKLTTRRLTKLLRDQLAEHDFGQQMDVYLVAEDEVAAMAAVICDELNDHEEDAQ